MGAYFVRRRSRNALYRRVLERYVQMATAAGVPQAMFPEGGLVARRAARRAEDGLLDYIVKAFDPRGDRDVVFVPVAVNYDRVLEDRTLLLDVPVEPTVAQGAGERVAIAAAGVRGAAGEAGTAAVAKRRPGKVGAGRQPLRFVARQLWLVVTGRWHRFGYACVSFGSPLSLAAWCKARELDPRPLRARSASRRSRRWRAS
jgi:glycerol-3-phosphate O-acyltransferase